MENIGDHYINKAILVKFLLHMHKIYLTSTSSQKSDTRFNLSALDLPIKGRTFGTLL